MKATLAIVLAGALLCANPDSAEARLWPQTGGWSVEQYRDNCAIAQTFEGEGATLVVLLLNPDGSVWLGVSNYNWSTVERQTYPLSYVLNGMTFTGADSVGYRDGLRKGFLARLPTSFLDDFASGAGLQIFNGSTLVDDLSLAGTRSAIQVLRRCVTVVRAEMTAAERERTRFAHIPRDPFAAAPSPVAGNSGISSASVPSSARANLSSYFSQADYPSAALRAGEEGTTAFRLAVGPDGRVADCAITSSSGSAALDDATCRIMRSRARFTPARDSSGNSTTDTVNARIRWTLPEDERPVGSVPPGQSAEVRPSRIWVQVAGSANRAGLSRQLARVQALAPSLLAGRTAWTTPLQATHRLLVGPFASQREAQIFVNDLARSNVAAFVWTSPAGQEIQPVSR